MSDAEKLVGVPGRKITTRIWDEDYNFLFAIDGEIVDNQLALPFEHEVVEWLRARALPVVHATVDVHGPVAVYSPVRRSYLLESWQLRRNGTCPECEHCQRTVLETCWAEEVLSYFSWRPSTSVAFATMANAGGGGGGGQGGVTNWGTSAAAGIGGFPGGNVGGGEFTSQSNPVDGDDDPDGNVPARA